MKRLAWSDSRYVRLYCDDHPDWNALSFEAQGMYAMLRREADRAGMIPLGLGGVRDLPSVIRQSTRTDELMPFVQELIDKRFLEIGETHAIIPEFIESENALASPAARKRKARGIKRDIARLSGSSTPVESPSLPDELRQLVFVRDHNACRYCDATNRLTVDHVLPRSRGGSDDLTNLVTACKRCNSRKKNRTPDELGWVVRSIGGDVHHA